MSYFYRDAIKYRSAYTYRGKLPWTKDTATSATWSQDTTASITWTEDTPTSATWSEK